MPRLLSLVALLLVALAPPSAPHAQTFEPSQARVDELERDATALRAMAQRYRKQVRRVRSGGALLVDMVRFVDLRNPVLPFYRAVSREEIVDAVTLQVLLGETTPEQAAQKVAQLSEAQPRMVELLEELIAEIEGLANAAEERQAISRAQSEEPSPQNSADGETSELELRTGPYSCTAFRGLVITASGPGYADGTYTDTWDKSARGTVEFSGGPEGWVGFWEEARVGRSGTIVIDSISEDGFSGEWRATTGGRYNGRDLPMDSGRFSCE